MENFVKFQSLETSFDTSRQTNLASFHLPMNSGSYDLSQSYVSLTCDVPTTQTSAAGAADPDAVYDVSLFFKDSDRGTGNMLNNAVPTTTGVLVKNASLRCDRGRVEEIRKVGTLRNVLAHYEKSTNQRYKDLNGLSNALYPNLYSHQLQNNLNARGTAASKQKSHEVHIPLSDIYNVGKETAWNTGYYGNTDFHLELQIDKLKATCLAEKVNILAQRVVDGDNSKLYGSLQPAEGASGTGGIPATYNLGTDQPFVTFETHDDMAQYPLYVGQRVNLNVTGLASVGGGTKVVQIAEVRRLDGSDTVAYKPGVAAPGLANHVAIFLTEAIAVANNETPSAITLTRLNTTTTGGTAGIEDGEVNINRCELVLKKTSEAPSSALQYTTYQVQEDTVSSSSSIQRTYTLPPNCLNVFVMFPRPVYSSEAISTYRLSLNGDQVSSRDITYGSGLHYDMISRVFANQGKVVKNVRQEYENNLEQVVAANTRTVSLIACPVRLSNAQTQLTVDLNATSGSVIGGGSAVAPLTANIAIYAEVVKEI